MPRFGRKTFYYWSDVEVELHNTERQKIIRAELWKFADLPKKDFDIIIEEFKKRRPELFGVVG